jgi:hypothetical protein
MKAERRARLRRTSVSPFIIRAAFGRVNRFFTPTRLFERKIFPFSRDAEFFWRKFGKNAGRRLRASVIMAQIAPLRREKRRYWRFYLKVAALFAIYPWDLFCRFSVGGALVELASATTENV